MGLITKPYTLSAGATIYASEHNDNYDTIYNEFNGSISNANISGSAAIAGSKINTDFSTQNVLAGAVTHTVTSQTTSSLTLGTHAVVVCDTTSNAIAITLPEAANNLGKRYVIFLETDGGNDVTVSCSGSDTLNGTNTTATLADAGDYMDLVAVSNDRWLIITNNGVVLS